MEKPRIFLSYAREDREQVRRLYGALSDAGCEPWMDEEMLLPGEKWELAIERAIRDSDFFVACVSTRSINKRGVIQKEIRKALDIWQEKLDSDIYLIPARLDECQVPESLSKLQWVDLFRDDGFERLQRALHEGTRRRGDFHPLAQPPNVSAVLPMMPVMSAMPTWVWIVAGAGAMFVVGLMLFGVIAFALRVMPTPAPTSVADAPTRPPSIAPTQTLFIATPPPVPTAAPPTRLVTAASIATQTSVPTVAPIPPTSPPTATATPRVTATPSASETRAFAPDNALMVFVSAGEFKMGSDDADKDAYSDEKPQHTVSLDAFWMDKYEVTNALYKKCVDTGKCSRPGLTKSYTRDSYYGNSQYDNYPVIYVSWNDAKAYCEWAGKRLPTEAEWEKAARGTDGRIYPWGNAFDVSKLNSADGNKGDTTPVGAYSSGASPYGIMDLAGNVWEWVADWYDGKYYASSPRNNPTGPSSGQFRVLRGGAWNFISNLTRAAFRDHNTPTYSLVNLGFRCVRSP